MKGVQAFPPLPKDFFRHNRQRLLDKLKASAKFEPTGLLFLSGPRYLNRYDDDASERIVFEPFFYYLFGIRDDVDTYAIIELDSGKAIVITERLDPLQAAIKRVRTPEEFLSTYEIDSVMYSSELSAYLLKRDESGPYTIYLNTGISPVSRLPVATPEPRWSSILTNRKVNRTDLYSYGREVRLYKSDEEVQILRHAIQIASYAHKAVLKLPIAGLSEKQVSDYFTSLNRFYDSDMAYPNIFCNGPNGAFLHYTPSPDVTFQSGQLCLNDSGGKVYGYNSDITRTFPINGKFTKRQRDIYDLVLLAQTEALKLTKPNTEWKETHDKACETIVIGLHKLGLIVGDISQPEIKSKLARCFMPHGLGHYIGLYVHDLPGLEDMRVANDSHSVSRINRKLAKGMVITVEPGIYFNDVLLNQSYQDVAVKQFLHKPVIEEYKKEVGGVRIEDMYLITDTGYEDLSKDLIKTADEIETYMRH